jgi:uncharacterized protein YjaZ
LRIAVLYIRRNESDHVHRLSLEDLERVVRHVTAVLALLCISACDTSQGVRTIFIGDYPFTPAERRVIARIADDAAREARQYLPALAKQITVRAQPGTRVIQELGAIAEVAPPDYIVWTVDTSRPEGVEKIAESYLRIALLHECHHLVRLSALPGNTLLDQVVSEGMATAFERDVGKWTAPWSQYPDNVASLVEEFLALPSEAARGEWVSRHPDRRIRYKMGTYLVDQAMKKFGKTSEELAVTPTEEIIAARPK